MEDQRESRAEAVSRRVQEQEHPGMCLGLERMRELMKRLGNPENRVPVIHVAGTNGKGSTAAGIASILAAAGIRTGQYTSPAVFDPREQYQINGQWMTPEEEAAGRQQIRSAVEAMERCGLQRPTAFEEDTALAYWYFAAHSCELAVVEAGLGGDEDATNVTEATICAVLTAIGMDHCRVLGTTCQEIAAHKAGIIKPGADVVVLKQEECLQVIWQRAKENSCRLTIADPQALRMLTATKRETVFYEEEYGILRTTLLGFVQQQNLAIVLEVIRCLRQRGYELPVEAVQRGIAAWRWPGRLELVGSEPDILLDGAHNPAAALQLRRSLDRYYTGKKLLYLMGVFRDKDYREELELLLHRACQVYTVTAPGERGLPAIALQETIRERFPLLPVFAKESVTQALRDAVEAWRQLPFDQTGEKQAGAIVVCGSLSILKEAREAAERIGADREIK